MKLFGTKSNSRVYFRVQKDLTGFFL